MRNGADVLIEGSSVSAVMWRCPCVAEGDARGLCAGDNIQEAYYP